MSTSRTMSDGEAVASEPEAIHLWSGESVAVGSWPPAASTLTFFRAPGAVASGATVLVCPGGGYGTLAEHEGPEIARWLNAAGFHAAVLAYRLAPHRHPAMIHDAQRAMRVLRDRGEQWGVDGGRIAVLGFSAGGHLASTLAVHAERFACEEDDLRDVHSAKPQATVLCYAVVDMAGRAAHTGCRANLLGDGDDAALASLLSTQQHVTAETPPTFLWHTADDAVVPLDNALAFASACRAHNVPVALHVYESGEHGLGLAVDRPDVATWTGHCTAFLRRHLVGQ